MITLDEYRSQREPRPVRDRTPDLKAVAQEAVRLAALTNDPEWDYFLRYIEASIKTTREHADHEARNLRNPLSTDEEVRVSRAKVAAYDIRVEVLEEILLLPKFLKEQGGKAHDQIEAMEERLAS